MPEYRCNGYTIRAVTTDSVRSIGIQDNSEYRSAAAATLLVTIVMMYCWRVIARVDVLFAVG
jgi:hypothetical protein